MPRYHIWTIGCQMNRADSERIARCLEGMGYAPGESAEEADVIVLNSCVVRQGAEDRVVGRLGSLKGLKREGGHPVIALTGCMVDSATDELTRRFPHVDLFFPPQDVAALWRFMVGRGLAAQGAGPVFAADPPRPSVFVPIVHGCNEFCAYCIVPYRRGREQSRPLADIVCQVAGLAASGTREVVLLGQNVNVYGRDLPGRPRLSQLLEELNAIPGLARIRFLTSHPRDTDDDLVAAVARLDKVCEHMSLPVQAGDDQILQAMGRRYTVAYYRDLVGRIRGAIPHVALSTDVIVGFPGEGQEQFARTYDLLRELRLDSVHVACYSPRPQTRAARELADDVPPDEKERRRQAIEGLQEGIAAARNRGLVGERVEVLVEGCKRGKWWGRTRSDRLVFFPDDADRLGHLVEVEVTGAGPWSLQGRVL
ncbi:MAG: tRNA (N6-isopentenyl adenosine(37)-C2)-methylthiotransferase MiaB [Chloroflexota bacterium]|nr:tRNA (N6-isopentenyl adenosine(37)-C2)-methylthiotransferase MiaB [Chloroflexota bacterium]